MFTVLQVLIMAIRQFLSKQLAKACTAVANDKSKEKVQDAVTNGRRKLADWISPDKVNRTAVSMVQVRVIG